MIILLDTSTSICKITLLNGTEKIDYEWQADRTLAKNIFSYLSDSLQEHNKTLGSLKGIGIFRGPGSFTGLRIGITVVNTMAKTLHIPIVGEDGDNWMEKALGRLSRGENDLIVLPLYGREARITTPRK
jgi:tRNA threonylcarbamoyladenosine biosynthesis protein TsaB